MIANSSNFLKQIICNRLNSYVKNPDKLNTQIHFSNEDNNSNKLNFIYERVLNFEEQVILLLGLVSHTCTNFFDSIIQEYFPQGRDFPEFGGVKSGNHRGMIPSVEPSILFYVIRKKTSLQQHLTYHQTLKALKLLRAMEIFH